VIDVVAYCGKLGCGAAVLWDGLLRSWLSVFLNFQESQLWSDWVRGCTGAVDLQRNKKPGSHRSESGGFVKEMSTTRL
jgi:hypothetical protein